MIGGIESPVGAMFGGFTLGILESFAVTYINAQSASWFPFVIVLLVLLIAPDGIFTSGKIIKKNIRKMLATTKVAQ
jgi:branched-chain amino acid transport system permease protein